MPYVRNAKPSLPVATILTIKEQTSFGQTFKKIRKLKNSYFVLVEKPKIAQMSAALILKVAGQKFLWIQRFSNPPIPNIISKMLIAQADNVIVKNKKDYFRLKNFGVNTKKIRITESA